MTIQKTPIIWQASWLLKNGTSILKMVWVLHQTSNRVTEIPQPKEIVCDKRQEMFFSNCDFIVYYRRRRRERFLYLLVTYPFPWCFPILGVPLLTKKKRVTKRTWLYMSFICASEIILLTWFPREGTTWWTIHWASTTPIFSWAGCLNRPI